jgi:hypothetical protein
VGEAKSKKERFLKAHPICCFCGGGVPATTVDHVPSRACFFGRAYPEGFEFPACQQCNGQSSSDEQAFALLCQLSDRNPQNYDATQTRKLIGGVRNNQPHLLPNPRLSANDKRRGLKQTGHKLPVGASLKDVSMAMIPHEFDPIVKRVTAKIGQALYYRHKGKSMPLTHRVTCHWTQASNLKQMAIFEQIAVDFTFFEKGYRPNLNFGDRFRYVWNVEEDGEPDIFGMIAQFDKGMVICAMFWDGLVLADPSDEPNWPSVKDILSV